jgi:hypothetical protein
MNTPKTKASFDNAYDQAMPEHGEGWDSFAARIRYDMEQMEIESQQLREGLEKYRGQLDNEGNHSAADILSENKTKRKHI